MLNRLIRWLARVELAAINSAADAQRQTDYANGFNAGRAIGNGEMLQHLRGDPTEPVTTEMIARRAAEMVH